VTATYKSSAPAPRRIAANAGGEFDAVLRRMVDKVDAEESSLGADLADTDKDWWSEADFVIPNPHTQQRHPAHPTVKQGPSPVADFEVDVRQEPATASASHPSLAEHAERLAAQHSVFKDPEPLPDVDLTNHGPTVAAQTHPAEPATEPAQAPPAPVGAQSPAWSAEALASIGVPAVLIRRIRIEDDADDLEWVSALASAIGDLLNASSHSAGPCELTGHGAASAVDLLNGACQGFQLDSIVIDGRRLAANPTELALAVRSLLPATKPEPVEPTGVMALLAANARTTT
jgi:hypothetical protein